MYRAVFHRRAEALLETWVSRRQQLIKHVLGNNDTLRSVAVQLTVCVDGYLLLRRRYVIDVVEGEGVCAVGSSCADNTPIL